VVKKKEKSRRHIPKRTCVGCREVHLKKELMRIVRTPFGILYDPTGKANGRGAYLHNRRSCWKNALKGALAKTLRTDLDEKDMTHLEEIMSSLPEGDNGK
jgi:predicted RNA-binding protein YlxR (DUF448 family)